ncbi:MAG: glycerol-3-phosphate 1-O-acyltransferase PlsY [Defluviitaleaceae bacterium]|nr:glycerol-3-phosphate 1-O-acyltransferase PlsY [Defluviitaleaceae bacterium]
MLLEILFVLIGYIVGCLQSAYIVGRLFGKIDIRDHGSGNAGMTNVTRVMGFKAGAVVLVMDMAKAVAAVMLANFVFHGRIYGMEGIEYLPGLLTGLGVVLGHNFPFYLKFRGGKGIASSIGVALMFDLRILAIAFGIALVVLIVVRYMSLASLVGLLTFGIVTTIFFNEMPIIIIAWIIAALAFFTHRANIVRLVKGEESKFNFKKSPRSSP